MATTGVNGAGGETPQPAAPPGHWITHRDSVPVRFVRMLSARRWAFLGVLVAVPVLALVLTLVRGPEYRATTTLLLRPEPGAGTAPGDRARDDSTTRGLLGLPSVAATAARRLGQDPGDVQDAVDVQTRHGSDLVDVRATGDSRSEAIRRANVYASSYLTLRRRREQRDLDRQLRALDSTIRTLGSSGQGGSTADLRRQRAELAFQRSVEAGRAEVAQPALSAENRGKSALVRNGLLGLAAGLVLALLVAYLLERLDRRLKSLEELEEVYELPILARIPRSRTFARRSRRGRDEALSKTLGFSEEAEAFRALRTNLRYFNVDETSQSILVVSPVSGDGKSTVARYLAITMASMGDRVVLVDADLRKHDPGVPTGEDGLSLVLAGFDLEQALTEVPITFDAVSQESRLLVEMPSGPLPPNPSELLESARMGWVIAQLERRFDCVIIDSPALMTVSDALSLVPRVSGVLVVGGFEHTTRRAAEALRKQLSLLHARPLGLVANFFTAQKSDYYYDYAQSAGKRGKTEA